MKHCCENIKHHIPIEHDMFDPFNDLFRRVMNELSNFRTTSDVVFAIPFFDNIIAYLLSFLSQEIESGSDRAPEYSALH